MMLSWKNLTIFEGNPKLSPTPVLLPKSFNKLESFESPTSAYFLKVVRPRINDKNLK